MKDKQLSLFEDQCQMPSLKTPEIEAKLDATFKDACELPSYNGLYGYYRSPQWRSKRRSKLEEVGHECEKCGSKENLEVHHRTYDNLYNEYLGDLQVLCPSCHRSADELREYDSGLTTYARKVYGDNAWMYDNVQLAEEFDGWLDWKEQFDW